jgi:hypothetical protein
MVGVFLERAGEKEARIITKPIICLCIIINENS